MSSNMTSLIRELKKFRNDPENSESLDQLRRKSSAFSRLILRLGVPEVILAAIAERKGGSKYGPEGFFFHLAHASAKCIELPLEGNMSSRYFKHRGRQITTRELIEAINEFNSQHRGHIGIKRGFNEAGVSLFFRLYP